jgi:hypothetical protein
MKRLAFVVVVLASMAACMEAQAARGRLVERTVVVPEDGTPFTVSQKDVVRLTGNGISGSDIKAKIEGPAKVVAENIVESRSNGETPIGALRKEFEVKPTGLGKVVVTIIVKGPQQDAEVQTTTVKFEVK